MALHVLLLVIFPTVVVVIMLVMMMMRTGRMSRAVSVVDVT